MFLAVLVSMAFSIAPILDRYEIEPWSRNYSPASLTMSMFDSAAAMNRTLGVFRIDRDSNGVVVALDTTLVSSRGDQFTLEQRRHDFETSPPTFSAYVIWLSNRTMWLDSSRELIWKGDSLTTEESAITSFSDGRTRTYRSTRRNRSFVTIDSSGSIRDASGRLVFRWSCFAGGAGTSAPKWSCDTDSILWIGTAPRIWWESGSSSDLSMTARVHHLAWDGSHLLVDSSFLVDRDGKDMGSRRTIHCVWRDSLLQSCTENDSTIVEMRHDPSGRPTYRRSDPEHSTEWWVYDSLGRIISRRSRHMETTAMDVDSAVFGSRPWPRLVIEMRCDSNGMSCREVQTRDHTFAYLDAIGVSGRAHRQDRILVRRADGALILTNLPRSQGVVRILDAGGRRVAASPWSGASVHIALPPSSAPLFWTASSLDGTLLSTGIIPGI